MDNALIRKLSVAMQFDAQEKAVLRDMSREAFQVPGRTDIINEGDNPDDVHLVLEGLACRYKLVADGSRQILALLLPGDFCDLHVALLHEMDHSIATLSPCTLVRVSRGVVDELLHEHPRLARAFWWATLVDESVMRENITGLGRRQTDRQMAHLFCELHARLHTVGLVRDGSFDLPMSQEELGDMLGVSIVHTNRMLMELRDKNLASFKNRTVTILDHERLKAFAGFRANYLHLSGIDDRTAKPKPAGKERPDGVPGDIGPFAMPRRMSAPAQDGDLASARTSPVMFTTSTLALANRRVLVVEDEYFAAKEMTAAVRDAGARVVGPVASVESALALIDRGEVVDAAILDIHLGGSKVFPVAQALREHGIPIVFVTGYDDWMIPQEYDDVPIVRKPADPDNVVRVLFRH